MIRRTLTAAVLAAAALITTALPAQAFTQYYETRNTVIGGLAGFGRSDFVNTGIGPATYGGANVYASAYWRSTSQLFRHATVRLTYYDKYYNVLCYFSGNITVGETFAHNCGVYGVKQVRVFEDVNYDDLGGTWSDFYPIP